MSNTTNQCSNIQCINNILIDSQYYGIYVMDHVYRASNKLDYPKSRFIVFIKGGLESRLRYRKKEQRLRKRNGENCNVQGLGRRSNKKQGQGRWDHAAWQQLASLNRWGSESCVKQLDHLLPPTALYLDVVGVTQSPSRAIRAFDVKIDRYTTMHAVRPLITVSQTGRVKVLKMPISFHHQIAFVEQIKFHIQKCSIWISDEIVSMTLRSSSP